MWHHVIKAGVISVTILPFNIHCNTGALDSLYCCTYIYSPTMAFQNQASPWKKLCTSMSPASQLFPGSFGYFPDFHERHKNFINFLLKPLVLRKLNEIRTVLLTQHTLFI
jgi:hypothetical protein